jgi:hypothetical protein
MSVHHDFASKPTLLDLRGKSVLAFFPILCSLRREIAGIRFDTYKPAPGLSERLENMLTPREQGLRDAAVTLSDANGIPFWDALLATSMQQGIISKRFIDSALAHDANPDDQEILLASEEISAEKILNIISTLPGGYGLAACSRVILTSNRAAHIPMLDFRCPCSEQNVKAIERMLTLIGCQEGILVESGRSYHFYGTSLLSETEWIEFMGRSLLFAPIVDSRFIGHRLVDGWCRLKVTDPRNGFTPRIADVFSSDV